MGESYDMEFWEKILYAYRLKIGKLFYSDDIFNWPVDHILDDTFKTYLWFWFATKNSYGIINLTNIYTHQNRINRYAFVCFHTQYRPNLVIVRKYACKNITIVYPICRRCHQCLRMCGLILIRRTDMSWSLTFSTSFLGRRTAFSAQQCEFTKYRFLEKREFNSPTNTARVTYVPFAKPTHGYDTLSGGKLFRIHTCDIPLERAVRVQS